MLRIALWDLDNCLADDEWRIPFIDWSATNPDKRYDPYHMRCGEDVPRNVRMFHALSAAAVPVFCTARPESVRSTTQQWIRGKLGRSMAHPAERLLMRRNGEHLPSVELKRVMAKRLLDAGNIVVAAFDDRQDVVEMYRALGIPAARLWIHDACAMTNPNQEIVHE